MFKDEFKTRTYEADFNNRLRLSSVLNFMQEVAAVDADQLGFGFKNFFEKGLFWVLSRVRIRMEAYPLTGESVLVETWPKSLNSPFALRDFQLYDTAGKTIGLASSSWLIMDINTRRPVRPDKIMANIRRNEYRHAIEEPLDKIIAPAVTELIREVRATYTDIDVNQHVNNVKYIEYVLDSYPEEFLRNRIISELQVNFINECKFGEHMLIKRRQQQDSDYVEGIKDNGTRVFQAEIRTRGVGAF